MDGIKLDGLFTMLVSFGVAIGLLIWGLFALIDWLWIPDNTGKIKSTEKIEPKIELVIEKDDSGKEFVDTIYVYEK